MSKRLTDTEKWDDPWFMRLSADSKLLFMFLSDKCDSAGFIERDDWRFARDTSMTEEQVEGALKELSGRHKGGYKLLIRGVEGGLRESTDVEIIWLVNRIKVQTGTIDLSSKNSYMLGCSKQLNFRKKMFPEIEGAYRHLTGSLEPPQKNKNNKKNNININKIDRESERKEDDFSVKETNPMYVDWVKKYPEMRAILSYERFMDLRNRWPEKDVDYYMALEWLYECELKSMENVNGFSLLSTAFSNPAPGKGFRKPGVEAQVDPAKAVYEKERARLNDLWNRGEIGDDECREAQAKNQAKYDGGAE